MKTYNVGDKVWWAKCGSQGVKVPCTVCYGKKEVIVILGNGDEVIVPCDFCGHGLEPPKGYLTEYQYIAEPELVTIQRISSDQTSCGEKREYHWGHYYLDANDIFDTIEEATERCAQIIADREQAKIDHPKYKDAKSYSWNAGYWLREIKSAERTIEYASKMARLCKSRSRTEKDKLEVPIRL